MIYTLLTNKAMRTAYAAHAGQVDKCGVPYIFHPIHLAEQMRDEISVCAALLHDVAEDTDITLSELESEFPSAVIDVLKLLTHKDGIDYFDYIRAIRQQSASNLRTLRIIRTKHVTRAVPKSMRSSLPRGAKSMKKQKPFFKLKIQTLLNMCFAFDNRSIADSGTLTFSPPLCFSRQQQCRRDTAKSSQKFCQQKRKPMFLLSEKLRFRKLRLPRRDILNPQYTVAKRLRRNGVRLKAPFICTYAPPP